MEFALIVDIGDYESEFYPETKLLTYKELRAWIKEAVLLRTAVQRR